MKKKSIKKWGSVLLALVMVLSLFSGMQQSVYAAPNTAPSSGYWTDADGLKDFSVSATSTVIGKIKFGLYNGNSRLWAICGPDGNDLALLSTSAFATGRYGDTSEYSNSDFVKDIQKYVSLTNNTSTYLSTDYFSVGEIGKMADVTVSTNEPGGSGGNHAVTVANMKLYLPNSWDQNSYGATPIYVGSGNDIEIDLTKVTNANGFQSNPFWLRSPGTKAVQFARIAHWFLEVGYRKAADNGDVVTMPAFNLDLSDVLFASAADAALSDGFTPSSLMAENTYTLRYSSSGSERAVISASKDKVTVTNASGKYLMVQNSTGVYAKSIVSDDPQTIQAVNVIMDGNALENFNNCKVWVESTTERVTTATLATQLNEITSVEVGITAPAASTALNATAVCTTTGVATASTVTWTPGATTAGYNTQYTASVTLIPEADYGFAAGVTAKVNGIDVTSVINADGTLTVTYLFPATAKAKLLGITAPTGITVANGTAYADMGLPSNVAIQTEGNTETTATVTWDITTPASGSYDPGVLTQQTVTLNGTVTCPGNIDPNGVSLNTTITVTISAAGIVGAPTFIPVEGTYTADQSVTLVSTTAGATIHYTTDGTDPTTAGTVYSGPIPVTGTAGQSISTVIKAIAVKSGMQNSSVVSATYVIEIPAPVPPTYTVTVNNGTGDGSYAAGATVMITADAASGGQVFDKWTVVSGGVTLESATSATTTFEMPAEAVEVTATYKDKPADPTPTYEDEQADPTPAPVPTPAYRITAGAKGTWVKGSDAALTFKGDGAFEDFVSVKIDGKVIDKENYTATAGTTVITLKTSYLNTLTVGEHTLEMLWKGASASTKFTVKGSASTVKAAASPNTGDIGVMYLWFFLLLLSAGGHLAQSLKFFGQMSK